MTISIRISALCVRMGSPPSVIWCCARPPDPLLGHRCLSVLLSPAGPAQPFAGLAARRVSPGLGLAPLGALPPPLLVHGRGLANLPALPRRHGELLRAYRRQPAHTNAPHPCTRHHTSPLHTHTTTPHPCTHKALTATALAAHTTSRKFSSTKARGPARWRSGSVSATRSACASSALAPSSPPRTQRPRSEHNTPLRCGVGCGRVASLTFSCILCWKWKAWDARKWRGGEVIEVK